MTRPPLLEARGVSLALGGRSILQEISFCLNRGEFLGIIGPNGAGKSTFLKCLGGLYTPTAGAVLLEGRPVRGMSRQLLARRIAWVFQEGAPPFTVREFARMSRYPWKAPFEGQNREDEAIVKSALETSGVAEFAERPMDRLSEGERQRAFIAAALAQGTDVLFLDEPLSFLDYRHQVETLQLIERINRERGVTVLLVTHDVNFALHGADRILAFRQGRIRRVGEAGEFLKEDVLSDVFGTGFQTLRVGPSGAPFVVPRGLTR